MNSGIFEDWAKKNQIVLGNYSCHLMAFNSLSLKGGIKRFSRLQVPRKLYFSVCAQTLSKSTENGKQYSLDWTV